MAKKIFGDLKKINKSEETTTEVAVEQEALSSLTDNIVEEKVNEELTHEAYSTFVDEKTLTYMVYKIQFNPLTGDVGKPVVVGSHNNRYSCNEDFKLNVVRSGIIV